MTSILDAYHQCWMQCGPAKGTELRKRARGQHVATIEAGSCILRQLLHVMEAELKKRSVWTATSNPS
eukprot:6124971-Pyramimonas_sp.AAC.1